MRKTNREIYRNNLTKTLKKIRKGNLLTQIYELFQDEITRKETMRNRAEHAADFLLKEKIEFYQYKQYDNKNVILKNKKKITQIKSSIQAEKMKKLENFKQLYPSFVPFLENEDFFSLVVGDATFEEITKGDNKLESIRDTIPNKTSYSFQCAFA